MKIALWKHHPQVDQNGKMLAEITIDYQRKFDFNFVKLTPAGTWLAVCYGAEDACKKDYLGRRAVTQPCITHWKHWQALPLFSQINTPEMLAEQLIASTLVCKAINDVPVYASVFSPLSQAIQLAGIDTFKEHLELYPAEIEKGLQRITQNTCYVLDQFKQTGIQGLFYVMQHLQKNIFPAVSYEKVAAYDEISLLHAASLFEDTLVHLHGEGVYWGLSTPIPRVRIHYGIHSSNPAPSELGTLSQLPVVAGISSSELANVNSSQEVKRLLASHFQQDADLTNVLLTCDCVLPLDFSDEQTDLWIKSVGQL